MALVGLISIAGILVIEFMLRRDIFSPIMLFGGLFTFILFLAQLRLFGMRDYSQQSVFAVEQGVLSFVLGALTLRFFHKSEPHTNNKYRTRVLFRYKVIGALVAVVTIGKVILLYSSIRFLLAGGSYFQLRMSLLGYDGDLAQTRSTLSGLLSVISGAGLYALIPIAIYYLVTRQHKWIVFVVFADLAFSVLGSGSRIILVYTVIQFLVVLSFQKVSVPPRVKRFGIAAVVLAVVVVVVITYTRGSRSFIYSAYSYFSAPVSLLSYWMDYVDGLGIQSNGLSFIYPFTYVANAISDVFGNSVDILNNVVSWQSMPQDTWVVIFPEQPMNAFCTLFYFFYQDFRMPGIRVFSFIFGLLMEWIYYRAIGQRRVKYLMWYLFGVRAIIGSFMIWQLGSTKFALSFFLLLICVSETKEHIAVLDSDKTRL